MRKKKKDINRQNDSPPFAHRHYRGFKGREATPQKHK